MSNAHRTAIRLGRSALDRCCRELTEATGRMTALTEAEDALVQQLLTPADDPAGVNDGWRRRMMVRRAQHRADARQLDQELAQMRDDTLARFAQLHAVESAKAEWDRQYRRHQERKQQAAMDDRTAATWVAGARL